MEKTPKTEKKAVLERIKGLKGWLVALGIVAAPIFPPAAGLAVIEGAHIGVINAYQDEKARHKTK